MAAVYCSPPRPSVVVRRPVAAMNPVDHGHILVDQRFHLGLQLFPRPVHSRHRGAEGVVGHDETVARSARERTLRSRRAAARMWTESCSPKAATWSRPRAVNSPSTPMLRYSRSSS